MCARVCACLRARRCTALLLLSGAQIDLWLRPVAMSLLCNVAVQRAADASSRATSHVALSEIACFPCATVWLRVRARTPSRTVALGSWELGSWEPSGANPRDQARGTVPRRLGTWLRGSPVRDPRKRNRHFQASKNPLSASDAVVLIIRGFHGLARSHEGYLLLLLLLLLTLVL